jgi:hypothetical protein
MRQPMSALPRKRTSTTSLKDVEGCTNKPLELVLPKSQQNAPRERLILCSAYSDGAVRKLRSLP